MSEGNTDLVWVPVGLLAVCVCVLGSQNSAY